MNILIIDGQGGRIGSQLVALLKEKLPQASVTAVGTNGIATSNMIKAGAEQAATGENPVITACRRADLIIGPVGIVIADSLLGEITPAMAAAVGSSSAKKVLIPMNRCDHIIVGVPELSVNELIQKTMETTLRLANELSGTETGTA